MGDRLLLDSLIVGFYSVAVERLCGKQILSPNMSDNMFILFSHLIIHVPGTADTTACHNIHLLPPLCFS